MVNPITVLSHTALLKRLVITLLVATAPATATFAADKKDSSWDFEAGVGTEFDSSIGVDEIDTDTSESDVSANLNFSANYRTKFGDKGGANFSYIFSQSLYQDFDEFDLQVHGITSSIHRKVNKADLGIGYNYFYTVLGDEGFIRLHQLAPYYSSFITPKLYTRLSFIHTDKNLLDRDDRDAQSNALSGDLYIFSNKSKTYLNLGYRYDIEDATDPQFDYKGHNLKVRWQNKFPLWGGEGRFRIGWQYTKRDYDNITLSIGTPRDDERHVLGTELEIPAFKGWNATLSYKYRDTSSNIDVADYSESIVGVKFTTEF